MKKIFITAIITLISSILAYSLLLQLFDRSHALQDIILETALNQIIPFPEEKFGVDALDIIFCGTGSPISSPKVAQQCIAVIAGDSFFIIDSGARSSSKAIQYRLPLGKLNGVLISHYHSDHISSLGELHLASWARGRKEKLNIFGGPGIDKVVDGFNMAYGLDYGYRTAHHGETAMPSKAAGMLSNQFEVESDKFVKIIMNDDLLIEAFLVDHFPVTPAYGFRITYKDRVVVISGDTILTDSVEQASKGADVLIHEAINHQLTGKIAQLVGSRIDPNIKKILEDTLDYHANPIEVAEMATRSKVDLLVFTHTIPDMSTRLVKNIFLRGVDDAATNDVLVSVDGTWINLPANSKAINLDTLEP